MASHGLTPLALLEFDLYALNDALQARAVGFILADPVRYADFKFFPCMPYAHKYANAVTELGMIGALRHFLPAGGLLAAGYVFRVLAPALSADRHAVTFTTAAGAILHYADLAAYDALSPALRAVLTALLTAYAAHAEVAGGPAHSWFVGYAPFNDPKIVVAIVMPAEGPSFGIAPSGTWTWTSWVSK